MLVTFADRSGATVRHVAATRASHRKAADDWLTKQRWVKLNHQQLRDHHGYLERLNQYDG